MRLTAALLLTIMLPPASPAADDTTTDLLQLDFVRLTSTVTSEMLSHLNHPVELHVRVTNQSDRPLILKRSELQLLAENAACEVLRASFAPPLPAEQELAPGNSMEGWVAFRLIRSSLAEPKLTLSWTVEDTTQSVSLNQVLRNLVNAQATPTGYQERITVLSIDRTIDLLTMWVLDEQMRALKKQGVERLVVDAHPRESTRLDGSVINWLQLANTSLIRNGRARRRGFPPPEQFREFHVTGFRISSSTRGQIMHRSRERAVSAAANTLYQRLSTDEAVAEFGSAEPGIRRAAMESSIDRLADAELGQVVDSLGSANAVERRLILELLDRVSSPLGVETLRSTLISCLAAPPTHSQSYSPETAAVAAQTLIRCITPDTEKVLREIWDAAEDDSSLRDTMIREVLRTRDYRWTALAAEYATSQLDFYSAVDAAPNSSPQTSRVNRLLRDVVRFLRGNDRAFTSVARHRLLTVTIPDIQDELLRIVLDDGETDLARQCITARLEQGSVTKQLLGMIHQLPDPRWTLRLIELHKSEALASHDRSSTLMTALCCATDVQLDQIIDSAGELDGFVRPHLYQQLIAMHHPRCAELLARALEGDETEFSRGLRYLPAGESPEMLQLVMDRYESFRQMAIEQSSLKDANFRMAKLLLTQLGTVDHPEARRLVNRSLISPDPGLRAEALRQLSLSHNRSRTRTSRQEAEVRHLKQQGKFDEALEGINQLIAQDPFCADFLLTRASLRMRKNQIRKAEEDVVEANRLSPGDVFTESTLALLKVRSGRIDDGLSEAEAVAKEVPPAATMYYDGTLYNTACVYSRALELPEIMPEQQQRCTERAIELMHQAAAAGFHDEGHVRNDPDLLMLHDHPEWPAIMEQITANQRPRS